MAKKKTPFGRFLVWRFKHISDKNFIYFLSLIVGLFAGLVSVFLKNVTHFITTTFESGSFTAYHSYLYFIFPLIGLLLVLFIKKFILRGQVGHGIPMALYAMSKKSGKMQRRHMFSSLITAPLTVGFGGSVGLEGPSVATGACFGSNISRLFHMKPQTRKLLLVCAAAGSLSAIFKAPIAAILFAIEVFSLDLTFASLLPLLMASIVAVVTRLFFIGEQYIVDFHAIGDFKIENILLYVALGIVAALVSLYFSRVYFLTEDYFAKIKNDYAKVGIAGVLLGVLLFFIPPLYGEGYGFMNNLIFQDYHKAFEAFHYQELIDNPYVVVLLTLGLILVKPLATSATLSSGGVGGVFAPVLFLGAATGSLFVNVSNFLGLYLPTSNFTLVGMAGLMAGVLQAPLTAIFLIAEITGGYEMFVPLMIVTSISFLISKSQYDFNIYTRDLVKNNELLTQNKDQSVLTLLKLDQVIEKNFISLTPKMTLKEMLHQAVAKSQRNLFPVLNDEGELVGVLTLDDIREKMFDEELQDSLLVEFLMHDAPDYIRYGQDSMKDVMERFESSGAWNLPVIDDENKYVGFVSKSKMLTAYRRKLISY
jgi:CIC family chloride channel protein